MHANFEFALVYFLKKRVKHNSVQSIYKNLRRNKIKKNSETLFLKATKKFSKCNFLVFCVFLPSFVTFQMFSKTQQVWYCWKPILVSLETSSIHAYLYQIRVSNKLFMVNCENL